MAHALPIAKSGEIELVLLSQLANRHGLITGATGTGKTVTLQRIAEQLSNVGVPVFLADAKGDLSGLGATGVASDKLRAARQNRRHGLGAARRIRWCSGMCSARPATRCAPRFPTWGRCCSRACSTSTTRRKACCNWSSRSPTTTGSAAARPQGSARHGAVRRRQRGKQFKTEYGNVSAASIGAIQRGLLTLEQQGGDKFFGEPMLDISDLMQDGGGQSVS
jgi:hypothetical protein